MTQPWANASMSKTRQNMVDLVIPVYNEARVLEGSLRRLLRALDEYRDFQWRIVIVNNGSTDDTAELAHRLAETDTPFSPRPFLTFSPNQ